MQTNIYIVMEEIKKTFLGWIKFTQEKISENQRKEEVEVSTTPKTKKILLVGFEGNMANNAKGVILEKIGREVDIETISYTDAKKELSEKIKGGSYYLIIVGCIPHKITGSTGTKDLLEYGNVVLCVDGSNNLSNSKSAVRKAVQGFLKNSSVV